MGGFAGKVKFGFERNDAVEGGGWMLLYPRLSTQSWGRRSPG